MTFSNREIIRDAVLLLGILLFSLPLKIPVIQQALESLLNVSLPIRLSIYTFFLPVVLGATIIIHYRRIPEVWKQLKVPLLILSILFIWMWLGAWYSEWRGHSLKHAGRYTIHLLVFLTLLLLITPQNLKFLILVTLFWFSIISGLTFADYLLPDWKLQPFLNLVGLNYEIYWRPEWGRLSSLFENPNPYGIASVAFLSVSFYALSQKQWIIGLFGLLSGISGIFFSGSRNAIIIFMILGLAIPFTKLISKKEKIKNFWKILIGLKVGSFFTILLIGQIYFNFSQRRHLTMDRLNEFIQTLDFEKFDPRIGLFRLAVEYGIQNTSLLGVGVKNFGYAVSEEATGQWASAFRSHNEQWNAHNALLTIWIEMGWVGLFLALGFLTSWFWKYRRASLWLMASVLTLCLGQILDYFIWQITFMTVQSLTFVLMAASAKDTHLRDNEEDLSSI